MKSSYIPLHPYRMLRLYLMVAAKSSIYSHSQRSTILNPCQIPLARDPKQCGGQEVNVPDTSSSSLGTCFGTRSNTMSTCQDLMPEPHIRTSRRILKSRQRSTFHIDLYRGSHKISIQELPYKHPKRTFIRAPVQSIFKISMRGPLEEDFNRISTRFSHKDLFEITM